MLFDSVQIVQDHNVQEYQESSPPISEPGIDRMITQEFEYYYSYCSCRENKLQGPNLQTCHSRMLMEMSIPAPQFPVHDVLCHAPAPSGVPLVPGTLIFLHQVVLLLLYVQLQLIHAPSWIK